MAKVGKDMSNPVGRALGVFSRRTAALAAVALSNPRDAEIEL